MSAAASLKTALTDYGAQFDDAKARFSFAGSDELAAQIRKGARPDVFASANTKLPDELFDEGLVEKPVTFAGNRLVLAVPAGSRIAKLQDVERAGTTLAIGSESVPVGSYTRAVLSKLPEAESSAILKNVRSEEPDVSGIVGKLTQGAVDAGFVYVSDVRATGGELKAIELPDEPAADRRLRRRGREGREASRTPRRRSSTGCSTAPARTRWTRPASSRRPPSETVRARPRGLARRRARVPDAARRRDLPRHLAGGAVAQPGGGGGARRPAPEPALLDRRARA